MEAGNSNRSVAATQMNASSSRAHTVIIIEFKLKLSEEGKVKERLSVINLVDLAGSEKVGKTGAEGDRLKEGNLDSQITIQVLVLTSKFRSPSSIQPPASTKV